MQGTAAFVAERDEQGLLRRIVKNPTRDIAALHLIYHGEQCDLSDIGNCRNLLIYVVRGAIFTEFHDSCALITQSQSLWLPVSDKCAITATGSFEIHVVTIDSKISHDMPERHCHLRINNFLRELILQISTISGNESLNAHQLLLLDVLLGELRLAPTNCPLEIPCPAGSQLKVIYNAILTGSCKRISLHELANNMGMSERSLGRLIYRETGMSFVKWRQLLYVVSCLKRMSSGDTVQEIALDFGYDNASSFINMFKRTLKRPPKEFFLASGCPRK